MINIYGINLFNFFNSYTKDVIIYVLRVFWFKYQCGYGLKDSLLEICHFATAVCNYRMQLVWLHFQLHATHATANSPSCIKPVACAFSCMSQYVYEQVYTFGLYGFIHPYSIPTVVSATACNYTGCVHTALHAN
jgi:hypothetical protein